MLTLAPLAALVATLGVSTVPTAPAGTPISVAGCSAIPAAVAGFDAPTARSNGSISISFVNRAGVAAKDVTFVVRYAGTTQIIDDRGTFSQNVSIDHDFAANDEAYGGRLDCSVASVTFADGTFWQAHS